ncbi:PadR family transcriptional regulator [Halobacillus sp. GSS1]|uniref:PadR family transcriptional regulator n=1 Tax=Halobacillus sp. GSS1 TaxID=2815919 RepID=UPI001A907083|nr:PadR family transcriptional regulator [Halobacillus sp. GSS1]MBN9653427.1 PadR family transcriptional regulator [Halobacillus sp. GSS1]
MEERLKKLKNSLDKLEFHNLQFSGKLREGIQKKLEYENEGEESVLLSIFQLLVQEKTGFTLSKHLRARGIVRFEDHEGHLYTILHRLEQKGYTHSGWKEDGGKYYVLTNKGKKLLNKYERAPDNLAVLRSLTEVLE